MRFDYSTTLTEKLDRLVIKGEASQKVLGPSAYLPDVDFTAPDSDCRRMMRFGN